MQTQSLRLDVFINGEPTHVIEAFDLAPDRRLSARRADLEEIGIKVSGYQDPGAMVDLASLTNVAYTLDEPRQRIDFRLKDAERLAKIYDATGARSPIPPPRADWGSVVNYSVYGTTTNQFGAFPRFSGLNASIDARAFGPYGDLTQTGIVGDTVRSKYDALRLDSVYTYSDPARMLTGHAGDFISGGLVWTRPIRMAGLQVQRNFGLRADLITQPLPSVAGTAAVPSTVDVFVNNVKSFSQEVGPGPYNITNLPVVSGSGTARVVITDSTGRQSDSAVPFFTTPTLLAEGLSDFSIDTGVARRNYGTLSEDYDNKPLGVLTGRRGLTDWLTLQAHTEDGAGLVNGAFGATARLAQWGVGSIAVAGSHTGAGTGGQVYAEYNFQYAGISIDLSTQRTLRAFNDLASVTATSVLPNNSAIGLYPIRFAFDPRPPRVLDRISFGIPLRIDIASVSASFIDLVQANGTKSRILTASISRPLPLDASFFATGFFDLTHKSGAGVFAGVTVPLGPRIRASVGGSSGADGRIGDIDLGKPLEHNDNTLGWRVRDIEGQVSSRSGELAYRSGYGTADVQVSQQGRQIATQGELDGSFGWIGNGGFFVGNRVQDSFALIDAGVPNLPIYQDNRLIGTTNPFGKLVLSDLKAYQRNSIGIDPMALPNDADVGATRILVSTPSHAGIGLNFGIDRKADAATLKFVDAGGKPLLVGVRGHVDGVGETFVVGYDGTAFVKHLKSTNTVVIDVGDHDCTARFDYAPVDGKRVRIGPVICQ